MSEVDIKKSILKNSPVIANSFNSQDKSPKQKNIFNQPVVKILMIPFALIVVGLVIEYTFFNKPDMANPKVNIASSHLENSPVIVDSPGALVTITKTDENIIRTLTIQATLIGVKKSGATNPPPSVDIVFASNSSAKLGDAEPSLRSPVLFRTTGNEVEVINNFELGSTSLLQDQLIESIKKNPLLMLPITTGEYSSAIETVKSLSVVVKVNGNEVLGNTTQYDEPWPGSSKPTFTIPIGFKEN